MVSHLKQSAAATLKLPVISELSVNRSRSDVVVWLSNSMSSRTNFASSFSSLQCLIVRPSKLDACAIRAKGLTGTLVGLERNSLSGGTISYRCIR